MLRSEGVRVARKNLKDYTALDCFHRGMWHLQRVSTEGYRESIALFREAIARDPNLAAGYVGLARILYGAAAVYGWSENPRADLQASRQAALKAIDLDPRDAYAHYALSGSALYLGVHEEALEAAQRAVVLNPNFALGYARLGQVLTFVGRPAEAIGPIERSLRHSPLDPQQGAILASLSLAHYQVGDYPAAVTAAKASLQLDTQVALAVLAAALARLGQFDEVQRRLPTEERQKLFRRALRIVAFANEADRAHYVEGLHLAGMAAA
jgi:tetratricopeptide (TPR) repeat protein